MLSRSEGRVLYSDHVAARGVDLFRAVYAADLEGIVANWKDGPYHTDSLTTSRLKIKNPTYSQAVGRPEIFEARLDPDRRFSAVVRAKRDPFTVWRCARMLVGARRKLCSGRGSRCKRSTWR